MKHLGDITKLNGSELPIVDIIVGGSPCQDLSIAGKRQGLAGERSGLFMEQIRIIKEMRNESKRRLEESSGTDDNIRFLRPRFMVWENVPGAFSSNKGEDFRAVLEETAKIVCEDAVIPRPEGGIGHLQDALWETGGPLLGEYMMHSFGECPKEERESRLSQIFEDQAHPKYSLSARACQGILRRAERRGKTLPEPLYQALIKQSASLNEQDAKGGAKESSYNMSEQELCPQ
jgi:DNA (cytosine-5)-methyltransferase 1